MFRLQGDNTYATIQHPTRRASSNNAPMSLADDIADYATLSGAPHNSNSSHSSLSRAPNVSTLVTNLALSPQFINVF